jgi:site-specific DNA-methyltransferase (adenine-specific)
MKLLDAKSIKTVVTSPPYNLGADYGVYDDERPDYLPWLLSVFVEIERVLRDDGHFFLQLGGTNLKPMIPFEVMAEAQKVFKLQNLIVWVKSITVAGRSTGHFKPINSGRFITPTNEFIFHLTKTGKVPIDRLAIGVPYADPSNIERWGTGSPVRCQGSTWFIPYDTIQSRSKERGTHPATFPLELPTRCIKLSGATGDDLILDPFAGIGTTLTAATNLGLCSIGYEIDPKYTDEFFRRS